MLAPISSFISLFDKADVYVVLFVVCLVSGAALYIRSGRHGSWDHFWQNFDKILAVGLFVFVLAVMLHILHHGGDQASLQWIENLTGQIWSSIAILLGVAKMLQRQADKNGNGNGNGTEVSKAVTSTTTVEVKSQTPGIKTEPPVTTP